MAKQPAPKPTPARDHTIRTLVIAAILGAIVGWFAATSPSSPIAPSETRRPLLRFVARVAKLGLWVMWAAEPAPAQEPYRIVHARIGNDGHPVLNHSEGW